MAISFEQYLDMPNNDFSELNTSIGRVLERMRRFREDRLAAGLPFSGRLKQTYEEMMDSLGGLSSGDPNENFIQALEKVNSFGAFLNVVVRPGSMTVREYLAKTNDEDDREQLDNDLAAISRHLQIQPWQEAAPLFDYRKQNGQTKKADVGFMQTLIGREGFHANRGVEPYQDALTDTQAAIDNLLSSHVDDIVTTDPTIRETARELCRWEAALQAAQFGNANYIRRLNINNREETFEFNPSRQEALEQIRDGFGDLLAKKIKIGSKVMTGEEWISQSSERGPKAVSMMKKLVDPATQAKAKPAAVKRYADRVIDELMNPVRRGEEPLTAETLAGIFGVRMAVGAERDNLDALKAAGITGEQKAYFQKQLAENPVFQRFCQEKAGELSRLAKKRGHGGILEVKFRDYLCKLPAGELPNEPILQRYMPSCLERIEALQKQAETATSGMDAVNAMAEIVVLRGMARANRGNKFSLDKVIRADESNSLQASVKLLGEKRDFQEAAMANRRFASEGHGGKLVERLRAFENDPAKLQAAEVEKDANTMRYLNRTTYGGQRNAIRYQAVLMLEALASGKAPDMKMRLEYRDLCAELFGLMDTVNNGGGRSQEDVQWHTVNEKAKIMKELPELSQENLAALSTEDIKKGLLAVYNCDKRFRLLDAFPERVNQRGEPVRDSLAEAPVHNL